MGVMSRLHAGRSSRPLGPGVVVSLRGEKELLRLLRGLPPKLQRKALRRGVTKSSRVIARAAKDRLVALKAVETGLLKKSLGVRVYTLKDLTGVGSVIGPRKGFKRSVAVTGKRVKRLRAAKKGVEGDKYRDPARYAHWVELGTVHSAPRPFLRSALMANRDMTIGTIRTEVRAELAKARAR